METSWRFTIQVIPALLPSLRHTVPSQQCVNYRPDCSLAEFKFHVRSKFRIPSQVDIDLFFRNRIITEANFKGVISEARLGSLTPTLQLSLDKNKFV